MTSQYSLTDLADCILVSNDQSVTQGTTEDIADGSQIDMSKYERIWVLAMLTAVGSNGGSVKFYTNSSAAASGQAALTQWNGTANASVDLTFGGTDDGKGKVQEIICHGQDRYLNIEVDATAGTGNMEVTIWALGVKTQYSAEVATAVDTLITSLTIA